MIENIYSNMGSAEGEYQVSGRRPPKNLRQIGFFSSDLRIYLEDYVHTFTHWLAERDHTQRCVAVLVGEFAKSEHAREVYAYGAVVAEHACDGGKIEMTSQVWTKIYETIKEFFPDGEIVGWFCGGTSYTEEEREEIRQVHTDHFAGTDRILMLYDFLDREEEFYRYEESGMARQDGYYIYYEKNTEMQEYMIEQKQGKGSEENVNDRAVQEVRARWNGTEKREEEESVQTGQEGKAPENGGNRFLYLVGIAMSAVALIAAASMLYNQERLKGFEQTLNHLIGNVDEEPDTQEVSGKVDGQGQVPGKDEEKSGVMSWGAPGKDGTGDDSETKDGTHDDGTEKETDNQTPTPDGTGNEKNSPDDAEVTPTTPENTPGGTPAVDGTEKENTPTKNPELKETGNGQDGKNTDGDNTGNEGNGEENNTQKEDKTGQDGEKENEDAEKDDGTGSVQTAEIGGSGPAVDTSNMQFYTVKPGDTLISICRKLYGNLDNLEYIKGLNQLNDENLIYVDQELLVP